MSYAQAEAIYYIRSMRVSFRVKSYTNNHLYSDNNIEYCYQ